MRQDHDLYDVDAYFDAEFATADRFWNRMGGKPDFAGARVLDVGSGHGALSIHAALAGAADVLGVDISDYRVAFARRKLAERFPQIGNVRFEAISSDRLPESDAFDLVLSKDTFEHVADVDAVLASFRRLLRPGGRAYIGFSPLWYSPFGDHGELGSRIPWAHVAAGPARVLAVFNRANGSACTTLTEAGFNMLTPEAFRRAFRRSGLAVESLRTNVAEHPLKRAAMHAFRAAALIPLLERYVTVSIYAVLRKPPAG